MKKGKICRKFQRFDFPYLHEAEQTSKICEKSFDLIEKYEELKIEVAKKILKGENTDESRKKFSRLL